jgi:hypothetical protein
VLRHCLAKFNQAAACANGQCLMAADLAAANEISTQIISAKASLPCPNAASIFHFNNFLGTNAAGNKEKRAAAAQIVCYLALYASVNPIIANIAAR